MKQSQNKEKAITRYKELVQANNEEPVDSKFKKATEQILKSCPRMRIQWCVKRKKAIINR